MKRLLLLTALLPFVGFAQPINTLNNPNQPGYQIPQPAADANSNADAANSAKGMLNQQLKTQTQLQQQHLENQINNNSQRVLQSQPGGERNPARQQMLPNTNGGMLNSNRNPDSSLNQQHMLPERRNGDMLNQPARRSLTFR